MKPHSLQTFRKPGMTPAQRLAALGPFARRYGNVPKGTVLPSTHAPACGRVKVADLGDHLPARYLEALEQNQQIASCCRHPENHEIEAFKSHPEEEAPDIYIFHCPCGRKHRRFCVGDTYEARPFWVAE
jgi:hypothetical protein